jgi:hypothetical protein
MNSWSVVLVFGEELTLNTLSEIVFFDAIGSLLF